MSLLDSIINGGNAPLTNNGNSFNLNNLAQGNGNFSGGSETNSDQLRQMLQDDAQVRVVKGVFMRAPSVKGAVSRPHNIDTTSSNSVASMDLLKNLLNDGVTLPESKLRQLGSQIVTCPADHAGSIAIPNGWSGERLRFMIVFEVVKRGVAFNEILTGYTDFDNPTVNANGQTQDVDPNMRLYFNNVLRMKPVERIDSFGGRSTVMTLMSSHQIMTRRDGVVSFDISGMHRPLPKDIITPTSIFNRMEANQSFNFGQNSNGAVLDTRTRVGLGGGGVSMINRANNLGSNVFANTLKGVSNAITELTSSANGSYNPQRKQIYHSAANYTVASETSVMEDNVLAILRQNSDYTEQGSIVYADFKKIFPEADNICEVVRHKDLNESYQFNGHDNFNLQAASAFNAEEWGSAHFTTGKAQQLLTSIPALMTDCLLSSITFNATNMLTRNFLEPYQIHVTGTSSYLGDNVDVSGLVNLFLREYETRIHPVLSDGGEKNYTFTMHCDVLGEMRMTIHYDGLPHSYNYSAGAYCDHLFSPTVSGDSKTLINLAGEFDGLIGNIYNL